MILYQNPHINMSNEDRVIRTYIPGTKYMSQTTLSTDKEPLSVFKWVNNIQEATVFTRDICNYELIDHKLNRTFDRFAFLEISSK